MWDEQLFKNTLSAQSSSHLVADKPYLFAKAIALQHPEIDFTAYLLSFLEVSAQYLPRLRAKKRDEALNYVELIEYFSKLDALYARSPKVALKIIMMIVALDNSGFNHVAFVEVQNRVLSWLQNELIPIKNRIDLAALLWSHLPMRSEHFKDHLLIPVLMPLFLSLAKTDPEYILEKFDLISTRFTGVIVHRDQIFAKFVEHPLDFLQFARNVHAYRPSLLVNALLNCVWEGRSYRCALKMQTQIRFAFTEQQLRVFYAELFDFIEHSERAERICQDLILDMPPNEFIYHKLFEPLWQIENAKPKPDDKSAKNFFLIAINNVKGNAYVAQAELKIHEWAFGFKELYENGEASYQINYYEAYRLRPKSPADLLRTHANYLMEFVANTTHPNFPRIKNFALPIVVKSNALTIMINAYWEMVNWLADGDKFCLLHVLLVGIKAEYIPSTENKNIPLLEEISFKTTEMFEAEFKAFMHTNQNEAGLILGVVIGRTSRDDSKFKNLLEEMFPKFYALSPTIAETAYTQAHNMSGSHSFRWFYRPIEEKRRLERLSAKKLD